MHSLTDEQMYTMTERWPLVQIDSRLGIQTNRQTDVQTV
jgi:hypothetical protein